MGIIATNIYQKVLWFHVSVHEIITVHVVDR